MSKLTKIFIGLVVVFVLATGGVLVLAQENTSSESLSIKASEAVDLDEDVKAEDLDVGDPNLLPSSPFYFIKSFGRVVRSFLTFDPVKKAELKLRFANERLIEAKKMMVKKVASEKIIKALGNYKKETERIKRQVEAGKLKIDNPKVEKFFENLIDRNFKQQKLLDKIEKELPVGSYEKIREIKEEALKQFTAASVKIVSPEELREKIEKINQEQKGSQLKHVKNLEVLMRVKESAPEQAKEALEKAMTNTLKRLKENIEAIPENEKPILKEYLERIGGNEVRHLEIMSEVRATELSPATREVVEQSGEESIRRIENKLKKLEEQQKEKYLEHLEKGDIKNLRVIKELEENLSPEEVKKMIEIKNRAQNNFRQTIESMETKEAKEKLLNRIKATPSIGTLKVLKEVEKIISPEGKEFLEKMKNEVAEKIKKEVEEAPTEEIRRKKLEAISSGSAER